MTEKACFPAFTVQRVIKNLPQKYLFQIFIYIISIKYVYVISISSMMNVVFHCKLEAITEIFEHKQISKIYGPSTVDYSTIFDRFHFLSDNNL